MKKTLPHKKINEIQRRIIEYLKKNLNYRIESKNIFELRI
jgi:hypothetical protein